jgi:RNA polymerase sigma-70 factor (ECF subfamily)
MPRENAGPGTLGSAILTERRSPLRDRLDMSSDPREDSVAEKRWLHRLASGDKSALGGIYELYGDKIFRYTYRMLGNRTDAEDATAETFLRVLRRSSELRADGAFKTWLFRIARNLCIDKMRQAKLLDLPQDTQYGGTEEKAALRVTVQTALSELPIEYREPLILCDLEDISAKEAAETLGISVPALKSRLYRGRRALREKLGGSMEKLK